MAWCFLGSGTSLTYCVFFIYFLFLESSSISDLETSSLPQVFLLTIVFNISPILCGFFQIIIYLKFKCFKAVVIKKNKKIKEILNKEFSLSEKIKFCLLFLLITVLDTGTTFCFLFQKFLLQKIANPIYLDTGTKGIQIFFCCLFCYYILSYKFENHKKGGIIIIAIGLLLNFFLSVFTETSFDYKILLIQLVINIGTSFQEVIEKYLMDFKYLSAYKMLFFEGIIGNIIMLIFFFSFHDFHNNEIKSWLLQKKIKLICFSIICVGYSVFRVLINRDYSPTQRVIAEGCSSLLFYIIFMIESHLNVNNIFFLIGNLIVCFGGAIYNEIIILTFCGLHQDTHSEIVRRSKKDGPMIMGELVKIYQNDEDNQIEN